MIVFYDSVAVFIINILAGETACDSVFQAFDGFLAIHECSYHDTGNFASAFATVCFPDGKFLGNVNHTSGQVTGVGGTKSSIGQTLTCTMCGHEVFQYVKTFTEVGLDRQFDGTSGCIRHQTTHTCQLFNLLVGTTRTGVSHHEDVVVLIQTVNQLIGQFLIGFVPGFYYGTISFFLGDKTSSEVGGNLINGCLSLSQQFGLFGRHGHIGNGYGHGSSGGILVAHCLDVVKNFCILECTVGIDNLLQNLL